MQPTPNSFKICSNVFRGEGVMVKYHTFPPFFSTPSLTIVITIIINILIIIMVMMSQICHWVKQTRPRFPFKCLLPVLLISSVAFRSSSSSSLTSSLSYSRLNSSIQGIIITIFIIIATKCTDHQMVSPVVRTSSSSS